MEWQFPQGIEVLVKKASVDADFAELLLASRAEAAAEIGLELTEAEVAMLAAVPRSQLQAIIARTTVPGQHRRTFLGKAAAAMLAALGMTGAATAAPAIPIGKGGTWAMGGGGMRMGVPPEKESPPEKKPPFKHEASIIQPKVIALVAKQLGIGEGGISRNTQYVRHLKPNPKQVSAIRAALEKEFDIAVPPKVCAKFVTIGDTCDYVKVTSEVQPVVLQIVAGKFSIAKLTRDTSLKENNKVDGRKLSQLRLTLKNKYHVYLAWDDFKKIETAGEVVGLVGYALRKRATPEGKLQATLLPKERLPVSRGVRPDRPKKGIGGSMGIRPE